MVAQLLSIGWNRSVLEVDEKSKAGDLLQTDVIDSLLIRIQPKSFSLHVLIFR